jgi:hypothetical protein
MRTRRGGDEEEKNAGEYVREEAEKEEDMKRITVIRI